MILLGYDPGKASPGRKPVPDPGVYPGGCDLTINPLFFALFQEKPLGFVST